MKLERIISLTLRIGVISSAILVVSGLVLFYAKGQSTFIPTNSLSASDVPRLLLAGNPEGVILLGVIVLILTPVVRVFELLLDYLWSRDRVYTILSLAVLCLMLFGILALPILR
ncbi:MAG: DUF1634 domain-containing protein [Conexivisphaerales archaeon]